MKELCTAEEARIRFQGFTEADLEREWDTIVSLIERAIAHKEVSAVYQGEMSIVNVNKLRKLGYRLKGKRFEKHPFLGGEDRSEITISFDYPEKH